MFIRCQNGGEFFSTRIRTRVKEDIEWSRLNEDLCHRQFSSRIETRKKCVREIRIFVKNYRNGGVNSGENRSVLVVHRSQNASAGTAREGIFKSEKINNNIVELSCAVHTRPSPLYCK